MVKKDKYYMNNKYNPGYMGKYLEQNCCMEKTFNMWRNSLHMDKHLL